MRTVALRVTCGEQSALSTATVMVIDQPAVFSDARPDPVSVGSPLDFQLPFTDPDSTSWTAQIDYGDGIHETLPASLLAGNQVHLHHTYKQHGVFAVNVTVTDSGGVSSTLPFDLFVNPVAASINVGKPITAQAGDVVDRTITFTAPVVETWYVALDRLGNGTFVPFPGAIMTSSTPGGLNTFEFTTTYTQPGTYNVHFRVGNGFDAAQDVFLPINVFSPNEYAALDETYTETVMDTGSATHTQLVGGSALDGSVTHVNAILDAGTSVGSSIFAASYSGNPEANSRHTGQDIIKVSGSSPAAPTAFFDLRTSFVGAVEDPTLTSTFTVEMDPKQDIDAIKVLYSNGNNPDGSPIWREFVPDPARPITKTVTGIDPITKKEIIEIKVIYDKNSSPSVFDLHGTVFTIGATRAGRGADHHPGSRACGIAGLSPAGDAAYHLFLQRFRRHIRPGGFPGHGFLRQPH